MNKITSLEVLKRRHLQACKCFLEPTPDLTLQGEVERQVPETLDADPRPRQVQRLLPLGGKNEKASRKVFERYRRSSNRETSKNSASHDDR